MSGGDAGEGARPLADGVEIGPARVEDAEELLPLMRAYCDFYEVSPPDDGLLGMARALGADPGQGGLFIARGPGGEAIGFAAVGWKWAATRGGLVGWLEDLFVAPEARGRGVAEALIEACASLCRDRGMPALGWMTAPDNRRAQAVYDRVGAAGSPWLEYDLEL